MKRKKPKPYRDNNRDCRGLAGADLLERIGEFYRSQRAHAALGY